MPPARCPAARPGRPVPVLLLVGAILAGAGCLDEPPPEDAGTDPGGKGDFFSPVQRLEDRTAGKEALLGPGELEEVVALPYPPGNVAVSASNRVFFTFHPEGNRGSTQLAELVDGRVVPYPDEAFQDRLRTPLGVRVDRQERLWVLDYGSYGFARPQIIAIDLATGAVVFEHRMSIFQAGLGSQLNDFQVSPDGRTVYIADQSPIARDPAILVLELGGTTRAVRRRLRRHASVRDGAYDVFVDGELVKAFGVRPTYGVDSIALGQDGSSLYYAPLNAGQLYRIATADLRSDLDDRALGERVEAVDDITLSDGIATDAAGHVYVTAMEHSALVRVAPDDPDGELEVLVRDERLRWPDGLSWGPDGSLYVTASALHLYLPDIITTDAGIAAGAPYSIYRLTPQLACADDQACVGRAGH